MTEQREEGEISVESEGSESGEGAVDAELPRASAADSVAEQEDPASNLDAGEETADPDETQALADLRAEHERLTDRHLRLAAEFENYRRRTEQELTAAWGRAQADFLSKLTDALDDLQRVGTWEAETTTVEAVIEGVDLVERKVKQALSAAGVEVLEPVGEAFNPAVMEAMMKVPTEDEGADDRVDKVFQLGYRLKGNLVRPARVSVFKND